MFDRDAAAIEAFKQEVTILAKLRHPNLILFMGYCLTPELCIVSEFMHKGCLYNILRENDGVPMANGYTEVVLVSVARAMAYLHSREPPILHLDLKSPNILIDNAWRVKITDFGLSRLRNRTLVSGNGGGHGTPHWMSPETIRGERIDEKSDVYSYGVIIWELLTGKVPWSNKNPIQVIAAVGFKNRHLPRPDHPNTALITLMESCFAPEAHNRPSFAEILTELDALYGQGPSQKMTMLKLTKPAEMSASTEPPSPVVGTMVEIFTSDTTSPTHKTQTGSDPSMDDSAKAGETSKAINSTRSVDRYEEFEQKLKSQISSQKSAPGMQTMFSPFAELASVPIDDEEEDEEAHRECATPLEGHRHSDPPMGAPAPSFAFSPFAAFSAMPFVDSGQLHDVPTSNTEQQASGDGATSTAAVTELRGDVSAFSHKSLKGQLSAVYDALDDAFLADIDENTHE